jgi:glycosyltransferase involved in cell wall biosynthesis
VFAVHRGVDAERFSPKRSGGRALVAGALGRDRPYVLFVSVPSRHKNLPLLREAVARLVRDGFDHALAIVGAEPPREWAEPAVVAREIGSELPGAPGRVVWFGHMPTAQVAELMAEADAFCLPSMIESFGLPALEAMACGAPTIVANRGALPEVVGDGGLVCEPTVDAISEALRRVLSDPDLSERLSAAGRRRAEAMTWRKTAEGFLGALRAAVAGNPLAG